jgi:hypothetical protein
MFTEKKYHAWKAKASTCEPIEGTDRILKGKSKRAVLDHLAYEENVVRQHYSLVVRCTDGTFWCVSEI